MEKLNRLDENIGATGVTVSADELNDINLAASSIVLHGDRYNAAGQSRIDRWNTS